MLNKRIVQGLLALAVLVGSGPIWAKKPTLDESMWIVELEDAPTIEFTGNFRQSVAADGVETPKSLPTSSSMCRPTPVPSGSGRPISGPAPPVRPTRHGARARCWA